jgi:hypothetical protein
MAHSPPPRFLQPPFAESIMLGRQPREMHATGERIAGMTCEVAFMIRRQSGDIDRDLQEIKELLGEQ